MRKKVIKAHQGMAHVPKPSASKAKGTAGTTPRPKRRIGLPQRFRGGRRTAAAPQAPPTVRPTQAMPEPAVIQQPKPVVRPPIQSDAGGGRGVRPQIGVTPLKGRGKPITAIERRRIFTRDRPIYEPFQRELPNKGRKTIQRPKPQSFRVPASRAPKVIPKPRTVNETRIMNNGGYVSRAKYGIVNNLKGK